MADFYPYPIVRLLHVAEVVALLLDAKSLPRPENFTPTRANREGIGNP